MVEQNSCWVCRRTQKEVVEWAEKEYNKLKEKTGNDIVDGILAGILQTGDADDGSEVFVPVNLYGEEKHQVFICEVCQELFNVVAREHDDFLIWLDEYIRKHYRIDASLEYVEDEEGKEITD